MSMLVLSCRMVRSLNRLATYFFPTSPSWFVVVHCFVYLRSILFVFSWLARSWTLGIFMVHHPTSCDVAFFRFFRNFFHSFIFFFVFSHSFRLFVIHLISHSYCFVSFRMAGLARSAGQYYHGWASAVLRCLMPEAGVHMVISFVLLFYFARGIHFFVLRGSDKLNKHIHDDLRLIN